MDFPDLVDRHASSEPKPFPLSRGQAALWFQHQIAPESVAYHLAGAIVVPDETDLEALRQAFQKLTERHPMLRTRFSAEHGEGVQQAFASSEIAFQYQDALDWDAADLDQHLEEEIYRPFDLIYGPPWRVMVFKQAPVPTNPGVSGNPRDHLVLLVLHHMIGDLWSAAILLTEAAALYQEEMTGVPAKLKPVRATYADHVKNEWERLAGPQAEESWAYWRTYLSGDWAPLNVSTDRPRPPVASGRGAAHTVLLDQHLTQALRQLAEKEHVALYTILLAAYQTLLYRYTGQEDILVGFPKAGRSVSTMRVVGYFVNQTVVRANFSGNPPFAHLLSDIQKTIDESSKHDWYPFSQLIQGLQPDRDLSRSPLIQAVFSWQQTPRLLPRENAGSFVFGLADQPLDLNGLCIRSFPLPYHVAPFDLTLLATEVPEGLALTIEYAIDLFEPATIARMADCYRTLLESIAAAPAQRVSDLAILPETERAKLIDAWNTTGKDYPAQASLQQLFEEQAKRTPQAVAMQSQGEGLTYQQLNQQANQVAHFLQLQGIGPDRLVGVYLEPSEQMGIALLGILKAGGAYLPLDPDYPQERLAYMLADAQPDLVLTRQGLRQRMLEGRQPTICLDVESDRLRKQTQTNPVIRATPDHLAYVIYTSGSTGHPKGVAVTHRGVVNLLCDFQQRWPISPGDACSWWTSFSFDVSVYEIFSPLLTGGSLQVIPAGFRLDAPRLFDWLQSRGIRSAYLPPFLLDDFAAWVERHPGASHLRRLLVGVEPIPHALLSGLRKRLPEFHLINGYGPTETTICSTLYEVDPDFPYSGNTPMGKPLANTQVYVLDRSLQLVPIGATGEVYIGGVGLARGYYHQPDLTEERFVPSPFRSGERLYRTGDLARFLPDANLIYVGRADTQVKLHGMRIELGEIESVLIQHPGVKQAVVLLQELAAGGKSLVAYWVPTQEPPPVPEDLRQFLSGRLPHTLVPTHYVMMESFPLTPTGKIDRKAFPAPQSFPQKQKNEDRAARTPTEQRLVAIWREVLEVEDIGINDNFFELGGDSIISLQVIARAQEAGIPLNPPSIFQSPTIAGLAALAMTAFPLEKQWVPQKPVGFIPLTPIQHWFFAQNFPEPHHWNQSLLLTPSRPLNPIHLRSAVAALIFQHDALRLRFTYRPSGWQQTCAGTDAEEDPPCDVIDLSGLDEVQQRDAVEQNIATQQSRLNLSVGPLFRVVYYDLGASRPGRLFIVAHHLVVDGVSWRILLEDLQTAYQQHERGIPIQLPPKTTSFSTWAGRLAEYAQSPDLQQEANFWLPACESCLSEFPVDQMSLLYPRDIQIPEATARHIAISLPRDKTEALLRKVPNVYGTETPDILLTALARALQQWSGIQSFRVDLEAHGREDLFDNLDLTRSVGWFTVLYPVFLEVSRDADPDQAIKIVKEQLHSVRHHGLGYGLLRYLGQDPLLVEPRKTIPPALILFNYLGQVPQHSADSLFTLAASEPIGHQRSPMAQRTHPFEVNAVILEGELHIDWVFSSNLHTRQAIEQLASDFRAEMLELIDHCLSVDTVCYTPSDFPGAGLSQAELDTIIRQTRRCNGSARKRNLEAVYPLSPMQEGMVWQTLYAPQSGVYFEQVTFSMEGQLDIAAFENAWQRVLDRHAILRTAFVWHGLDRVLQVVQQEVKIRLEWLDWRSIAPSEQPEAMHMLLTRERDRGFDLTIPPLWSLVVCQTGEAAYQVLFNHHHALLDGWSIPLLFQEVFAFYEAFHHQRDLPGPLPRPYQDYITWLERHDLSAAEAFWRKELKGFDPVSWLHPQPALAPLSGASRPAAVEERLSVQATHALHAFARQQHITLSTLIQGAWALLLNRHLKRDDLLFGITATGRPLEVTGVMQMLGLFINTLPLRVQIVPSAKLADWLQEVQQKTVEIQQFHFSPLAQIHTWSGISRGSDLFDTLLVVENYPTGKNNAAWAPDLRIGSFHSIEQAPYPLTIAALPGSEFHFKLLYDPTLFEPETVKNLLNDLFQVLETMIHAPDQPLSALYSWIEPKHELCLEDEQREIEQQIKGEIKEKEKTCRNGYAPPANPLDEQLVLIWQKVLKLDQVGIYDNFFDLGGDSLQGAICIYQLQEALQDTILLHAIFESPTIDKLSGYLQKNHPAGVARILKTPVPVLDKPATGQKPLTIVPIQPDGKKRPLFCIHPAGGIVFPYYTLAHYLGEDQPVYGIQDPSLYSSLAEPGSIEAMASEYLLALKTVQPEGPYHLLGWSVGGIIAYEMAQQLSRHGQTVTQLILLDTHAPATRWAPQPSGKETRKRIQRWFQRLPGDIKNSGAALVPVAQYIRSGLFLIQASMKQQVFQTKDKPGMFHLLGWAGLDTWRVGLLQEAEVSSAVSRNESLLLYKMPAVRRILEFVWEHRKIAQRYAAQPYHGRITLFRAVQSNLGREPSEDRTMGWEGFAENGIEVHTIQSNHVALLVKPYVVTLAQELRSCLERGENLPE